MMMVVLSAATPAVARILTSDEALARIGRQHFASKMHRVPAASELSLAATGRQTSGEASYYVFNISKGGYIVAAADEAMPAVMGYVDSGAYDAKMLPPAFLTWLQEAAEYGVNAVAASGEVQPLLGEIVWTQDTPMNDLCPRYLYDGYNYPTYAGCAAIAMGQIMRYHQHPAKGEGQVDYETDTFSLPVNTNLAEHTYDWSKILPNYIYTTPTKEQRAEVAKLVFDLAAAMQMDFHPGASSTQDFRAAQALKKHFDYDAALQLIDHANYSTGDWADLMRQELDAKRPVYLSGVSISNGGSSMTGHAFVVDGYNQDGYFHINWGWNGTSNGYFLLTDLTPKNQGVGGGKGGYAFMQNAVVGIQPNQGNAEAPAVLTLTQDQIWMVDDENGRAIHFNINNQSATDFTGYIALRVTNGAQLVADPMDTALKTTCKCGWGGERAWYIDAQSLKNYPSLRFEIVYKVNLEDEWQVAGARLGSPHSLLSYEKDGKWELGYDANEMVQLRLASLTTQAALKPGVQSRFTAVVKNVGDIEYFAPLYMLVYDEDGAAMVGYSDDQLVVVPAHGEATVNFDYDASEDEGKYLFAVGYETLGYNYDYSPMQLSNGSAYGVVMEVGNASGEGPAELTFVSLQSNASMVMTAADALTGKATFHNKGGSDTVTLIARIVNPNRTSEIFESYTQEVSIAANADYDFEFSMPLEKLEAREYRLDLRWQNSTMVLPRNVRYVAFAVIPAEGVAPVSMKTGAEAAGVFTLTGQRVSKAAKSGLYIQNHKKLIVK